MSSHLPTISVVTIVRNAASEFELTLQSVRNLTYPNIEYVVIDGASTDGTRELIQSHSGTAISKWLSEPDSGTSEATNKGWKLATGDLVAYLNAGDWYEPDALDKVGEAAQLHPGTIIHGNTQCWDQDGRPYGLYRPSPVNKRLLRINHPAAFIPMNLWQESEGFDLEYSTANDYEFYLRLRKLGADFHHIDSRLTNYKLGGMSDIDWLRGYKEVRKANIRHGASYLRSTFVFLLSSGITASRRTLEKLGMKGIVHWYRRRFAFIRRHYDANPMESPTSTDLPNASLSSDKEHQL